MEHKEKFLFGPVPSRRLGLSLGVDIIPFKLCTLDCVYCQLGPTTQKTIERKEYVPVEPVFAELKKRIADGLTADYITFSGSGEPTLNSKLGELILSIKKITTIPIAVLTNGSLFYRKDVRDDCSKADLVLPSLDAADKKTFQKINQPHPHINIDKVISGLAAFRKEFKGRIWLEVLLVDSINTEQNQLNEIKKAILLINPDEIQLNTAVRPTTNTKIKPVDIKKLTEIAEFFGPSCRIIADFPLKHPGYQTQSENQSDILSPHLHKTSQTLLSMLKRRPSSINDISSALDVHKNQALKLLTLLEKNNSIFSEQKNGITFYRAK